MLSFATLAQGATVRLNDGRVLKGKVITLSGVADDPNSTDPKAGEVKVAPILLVDDGLRRTYVGKAIDVKEVIEGDDARVVRLRPWQNVAEHGGGMMSVGPSLAIEPWDKFGRRRFVMQAPDGPLSIIQGMTEITPDYVRVEGLTGARRPIQWDMRLATSSIPRDQLSAILHQLIKDDDYEGRLQIVQLYLQSERYVEAADELDKVGKDFPDREELGDNLRQLRQLSARSILREIELRQSVGQHTLVKKLLPRFPSEDVAGETLQQVREILTEYDQLEARKQLFFSKLSGEIEKLADASHQQLGKQLLEEVKTDLTYDTLNRTASFMQLVDDEAMTAERKVALAMSGWLLGSTQALDNFGVAASLMQVRNKVVEYLREDQAARRAQILHDINELEGGTPERVAEILKLIKPPEPLPEDAKKGIRFFDMHLELPAPSGPARYLVQLPPDYDPLRHYPTILTLNGHGYRPELQLDYWAGGPHPTQGRIGQAMRHGYIVIAVDWLEPHQAEYNYSLREHQAVLGSLRDAMRRFSIDTDRVFLTGHGIGGDAAWDIGLAHPDLWAGVIPFLARSEKYTPRYRDNASHVDWYFVDGELNGDNIEHNATQWDFYLRPGIPATLVEYRGRGFEPYHDEIQRLFDWMSSPGRRRRLPPAEFEVKSMRPWDNFFWWLEVEGLPERSMVAPETWPPDRGTRPTQIRGRMYETNKLGVFHQAERTTVWLSPDFVDFQQPMEIEKNGTRISPRDRNIEPDLRVMLEDARTRCDRLHPYWAKVTD
ncbi:carboxylesterase family protein [Aeoliella mucimassa]|uniref:carboxylesterase family protein n=1 Tax=Aeoliella mucimassa TaxID=2527972 RepID=UPI0018D32586|nr:peptidase [Aeoliella mucimassa]